MFGSRIVAPIIATELATLTAVTSAVGDRIFGVMTVPQDAPLPGLLFYQEFSTYSAANGTGLAGRVNYEGMRYVVRLICKGESDDPILAAAEAQFDHFHNATFNVEVDGVWHYVTFSAQGEIPLNSILEGTQMYRQLGTTYDVEITRGG